MMLRRWCHCFEYNNDTQPSELGGRGIYKKSFGITALFTLFGRNTDIVAEESIARLAVIEHSGNEDS